MHVRALHVSHSICSLWSSGQDTCNKELVYNCWLCSKNTCYWELMYNTLGLKTCYHYSTHRLQVRFSEALLGRQWAHQLRVWIEHDFKRTEIVSAMSSFAVLRDRGSCRDFRITFALFQSLRLMSTISTILQVFLLNGTCDASHQTKKLWIKKSRGEFSITA